VADSRVDYQSRMLTCYSTLSVMDDVPRANSNKDMQNTASQPIRNMSCRPDFSPTTKVCNLRSAYTAACNMGGNGLWRMCRVVW
jgi:hypothetical protein